MSKVLVFNIGHQYFIGPAVLLQHLTEIVPVDHRYNVNDGSRFGGYTWQRAQGTTSIVEVTVVDESEIRDPKPEPQLDPASEPAPTGEAA